MNSEDLGGETSESCFLVAFFVFFGWADGG